MSLEVAATTPTRGAWARLMDTVWKSRSRRTVPCWSAIAPPASARAYHRRKMAGSPDLFVVCKNCGSEVSPYITECPYCGTRLRKRAPKIERDGTVSEPKPKKQKRQRSPRTPRVRGERTGVRAALSTRPWATLTLVVLSLFGYLVLSV